MNYKKWCEIQLCICRSLMDKFVISLQFSPEILSKCWLQVIMSNFKNIPPEKGRESNFMVLHFRDGAGLRNWRCKRFYVRVIVANFLIFLKILTSSASISQKLTVHLHPLHPPYAAPALGCIDIVLNKMKADSSANELLTTLITLWKMFHFAVDEE